MMINESLDQYFTPVWAAERIISHYYSDLGASDVVFDVGCGDGRILMNIPRHVTAYGFEIDPTLAQAARSNSGREVIEGCFTKMPFPERPTVCIGNPPYDMSLVNQFLDRTHEEMDYGGRIGLLLPVYFFQTADTVCDYMEKWSLQYDLMPRNMFPNMSKPVMWESDTRDFILAMLSLGFLFSRIGDYERCFRWLWVASNSCSVISKSLEVGLNENGLLAEYNSWAIAVNDDITYIDLIGE